MKNQERLSDINFLEPNLSEEEIDEIIQGIVYGEIEKAITDLFPMKK